MTTLRDGSVLPHFLKVDHGAAAQRKIMGGEYALKMGVVSKIYFPEDKQNTNKLVTEYDVLVRDRDHAGNFTISTYRKCVVVDMFGGKGDVVQWTLRPSTDQTKPDPSFHDGSMVIILCMYGDKNNPYIIGGTRHKQGKAQKAADGHRYEFEFNGWNMEVNKDGECTMTYRSKTDNEGVPADTVAGGSFVKFEKDGSIVINDNKACRIRLDKPTSDITIETTGRDIVVHAKRDMNTTIDRNQKTTVHGKSDTVIDKLLTMAIGDTSTTTVAKDCTTTVGGKTVLKSKGNIEETTGGKFLATASSSAKVTAPLIELTSGSTAANDGVITGQSVDPFTGVPHIDFSVVVRAKK